MELAHFCFSGTLGDAYIVYCKLYDYWKKTKKHIKLYRYSRHIDFDKPISELFSLAPFIEYQVPCTYIKDGNDLKKKIKNKDIPYINICWYSQLGPFPDPPYIKMDPYPEVFLEPIKGIKSDSNFTIGIQLQSGKRGTNFKGFSVKWLKKLRKILPKADYEVFLFGTGDGYNRDKLELFCKKYEIKNFVGQLSFLDWLRHILSLDFFITFEGFSAFFAMSKKIPSLVFYTTDRILIRVPQSWRRDNIIMSGKNNTNFLKLLYNYYCKTNFLNPLPVNQVKSFLDLRTKYIL